MQHFIEAYDPGDATGYVYGWFGDGGGFTPITFQTLTPLQVQAKIAWEWPRNPDRIRVVESFRLRGSNKFTASLVGKELIGAMKLGEYMTPDMKPIVWQKPEDKALVPDWMLRAGGLWRTPGEVNYKTARHVNDASIHILIYLKRQAHVPTLRKYSMA